MAILSGFFGLIAALMAAAGLYGVMSYLMSSRRSEFGIRAALGASRAQIRGLVMREVCVLLLIGSLLGVALSLLAGRAASSLLFGLKPYDPFALAAACVLLIAVSMLASSLPAQRASKLDPIMVLRCE